MGASAGVNMVTITGSVVVSDCGVHTPVYDLARVSGAV